MSDESTSGNTSAEVERIRAFMDRHNPAAMMVSAELIRFMLDRLPSPESVTRARLVAAEIVEMTVGARRVLAALGEHERVTVNRAAEHVRDRARTHSGTRDEGGDVDERELLWCAARVDGCTTLGELEALVREWREVA